MLTPTTPYRKDLGDGLTVRSIAHHSDVERLAAFSGAIHGTGVADMTRELILRHPHTRPEHWLLVEDQDSEQIVSSLCLIPWTLSYEDILLRAGEMGIVGTLETYRRRGLVRAQSVRHDELLRDGSYDLSHIQGIPYFYRQFGYEYAMPLEGGWRVDLHALRDAPTAIAPYAFRVASIDDLPTLTRLYDGAVRDLGIHTLRDADEWRYLLGPSQHTEMVAETWLVSDASGTPVSYLRLPRHGFGEGLIVNEVSPLSADAALALLHQLVAWSTERGKPYIRLCLPSSSALVQVARCYGAHDLGHYAWQVKLVNIPRLLLKIAPVLERRLAVSPFAGLTRELCLNLYCEAFELRFQTGELVTVESLGFTHRSDIRLPPPLLAPLVLGYRTRAELAQAHHDVSIGGDWQYIVDILFPKMDSFLYTIY